MKFRVLALACLALAGLAAFSLTTVVSTAPAAAQTICYPGVCGDLWYQRNAIYARKGYCFQTARARSVFGRRCYPPYGRLTAREQRQVANIQRRERNCGCN